MPREKVKNFENHLAGLSIASVIAFIIITYLFDIPLSKGPLSQLFQ